MKAVYHPLVHTDIAEAMEFYEHEGGGELAADFFREVESSVKRVLNRPHSYVQFDEVLRRVELNRFPFHFLFSIEPGEVFVLALRHNRRHPNFGLDR